MSELKLFEPKHDFFIASDSDGCVFDTMEVKHKECFIPNTIKHWGLQPIAKFARAAAEFVNLYSKWRGANRFPALILTFDLLKEWDAVRARGAEVPEAPNLREWIKTEKKLANPALEAYCATHDDPDMHQALRWSRAINAAVEDMVYGVPPFPYVRESLARAAERADIIVSSSTPYDALEREWEEHGIARYAAAICGQEIGNKREHIARGAAGRYAPERMLMIGDAPGDMEAAKANGALFYPIVPGDEDRSWRRFHEEALDRFFAGTYAGDYEAALIREFDATLPDTPPWKR